MFATAHQTTTRTRPPTLAEIIREETDDGRFMVRILKDIAEGKTEDAKTCHQLPATMELIRRAFDTIPDHVGDEDGKAGTLQPANVAVEEHTDPETGQPEEEKEPAPAPIHSEVDETGEPESREPGPDQPAEEISPVGPGPDQPAEDSVPGEPFPDQSLEDPDPGETRAGRHARAKRARLRHRNRLLARSNEGEARQPRDPGNTPVTVDNARDPPPP